MNSVFIVPTGLGAEIGGHSGDAAPALRLCAEACDVIVTHPNVVNAADINTMPDNCWYVEGSMLDFFLENKFKLRKPRVNRVLVCVNEPSIDIMNIVSAARATLGLDAFVLQLQTPLRMIAEYDGDGLATGSIKGERELITQVWRRRDEFDALAIFTPIESEKEMSLRYLRHGGVNPWGGVEAKLSKLVAKAIQKPVAHAPVTIEQYMRDFEERVDSRISAEAVCGTEAYCVLYGLWKAPRISGDGLSVFDIDAMVSPWGCYGPPHEACARHGVPIIYVKENRVRSFTTLVFNKRLDHEHVDVNNYVEAAGALLAMKSGVSLASVRRPLADTRFVQEVDE